MINRIKEVARHYGLSSTAFADQVEIPRPVISHIFSERNRPSLEVIQKIGNAFPEVKLEWLLYGKGEMLLDSKAEPEEKAAPKPEVAEHKTLKEPEPKKEVILKSDISETKVLPNQNPKKPIKRTMKIVFIYDDGTFEEFKP